ncbi:hypothetical protein [Macellibacteroides fermentans]|uniref:hypothetical protein n=1 Tax=Macellibacteroides fermentans TaxID=879969 RepID=UPI00406CA098
MKILVACEESQAVTIELRKLGHEAYSCDIEPCSGGHPEWHFQQDVSPLLNQHWDMIIAFPPCTYLTVTGNKWFKPEYEDRFPTRKQDREKAIQFFLTLANADCERIAIENPVGIMSSHWRKPDQIIQPYYFGHEESKKTCLWLKGLPKLIPTKIVEPVVHICKSGAGNEPRWHMETMSLPSKDRSKARSKTFPGIAKAMAQQWTAVY